MWSDAVKLYRLIGYLAHSLFLSLRVRMKIEKPEGYSKLYVDMAV